MAKRKLPKNVRERDGKYYYRYDIVNPATGKRKQKETRGFATPREAEREGIRIQAEILKGTYIEEKGIAFEDFSNEWLEYYEHTGKVKISTVRVRKHEVGRLLEHFKRLKIKDISRAQYQKALNELHTKFADNTLDGIHRTARMIFKRAVELEAIKSDPTEFAYVPKTRKTIEQLEEKRLPKYLEKGELSSFLQVAKEQGLELDYPVFLMLAYTGMRIGELCALKWNDIDQIEQTIRITKTYYNPSNNIRKYTLLTPKTKTSRRSIDVEGMVTAALDDVKAEQKVIKMANRKTYHNKDFVFVCRENDYAGYPIYPKLIENRMKRLLKLAGLNPSLTPHSLRHTHTSLLAEAEVSLEQIMARLGHSDDDTTRTIYLHVTKPRKKEASHKFAELMRSL